MAGLVAPRVPRLLQLDPLPDTYNSAIRLVTFAGIITTVAGTPTLSGFTGVSSDGWGQALEPPRM